MLEELKKEMIELSKNDVEFINGVFEEINFFEKILNKDNISKEEQDRIDKIIDDVDIITDEIYTYTKKNIYYRFHIVFIIISMFMSNQYYDNLDWLYDVLEDYEGIIDELDYFIDSYKSRSKKEVYNACYLSYLTYLTVINDVKLADLSLMNFKKYSEDDIINAKYSDDKRDMLYLTVKNENRNYKKLLNN